MNARKYRKIVLLQGQDLHVSIVLFKLSIGALPYIRFRIISLLPAACFAGHLCHLHVFWRNFSPVSFNGRKISSNFVQLTVAMAVGMKWLLCKIGNSAIAPLIGENVAIVGEELTEAWVPAPKLTVGSTAAYCLTRTSWKPALNGPLMLNVRNANPL